MESIADRSRKKKKLMLSSHTHTRTHTHARVDFNPSSQANDNNKGRRRSRTTTAPPTTRTGAQSSNQSDLIRSNPIRSDPIQSNQTDTIDNDNDDGKVHDCVGSLCGAVDWHQQLHFSVFDRSVAVTRFVTNHVDDIDDIVSTSISNTGQHTAGYICPSRHQVVHVGTRAGKEDRKGSPDHHEG